MADLFKKLHDKRSQLFAQLNGPAAVGVWKMVVDKYSDQAHFLYELLQNADDAGATSVRIVLNDKCLHFIHNGTVPFTITDVDDEEREGRVGHLNAITSIGASSKSGTNAIGKFGVGFKSVFQYTDVPHIEDDGFSFRIENYIVPVEDEPVLNVRRKGETLFYIPFRKPERAKCEILAKLKILSHPLLFLRSLCSIEWSENGGESGSYKKENLSFLDFPSAECAFVKETDSENGELEERYYYIFSRNCAENLKCSVAYSALSDCALDDCPYGDEAVFCYFPTREVPGLNFILHAPFLLTDSREGIKKGEEWNDKMLSQLADLATDALGLFTQMRDDSGEPVLTDNLFSFVPLEELEFSRLSKANRKLFSIHSFFYGRFVEKLSKSPVFYTEAGYVDAAHTRFARNAGLIDLLQLANNKTLLSFMGDDESGLRWAFRTVSIDTVVGDYLVNNGLIACEVTDDELIRSVNPEFLKAQSLDFLKRFYGFFLEDESDFDLDDLRDRLPILCSDGEFRTAFDSSGKPLVFLSSGGSGSFLSVHPELLNDACCKRLFICFGITNPDVVSEVECVVLPKYQSNSVASDDWQAIFRDMNLIVDVYQRFGFQSKKKERFLSLFRDVELFPSTDNRGVFALRRAADVYAALPDLRVFLSAHPEAAFLDERLAREGFAPERREAFYQFLSAVGVSFGCRLRREERVPRLCDYECMSLNPKSLRQYDKGCQRLEDCEIDGFSSFLECITEASSAAFFRLLAAQVERQSSYMLLLSLQGRYRYVEKSKKKETEEVVARTTAWHSIFSENWLYDAHHCRRSPSQIESALDLSPAYAITSPDILFFLGIPDDSSLRGLDAGQRRAVKLVGSFAQEGISLERMERLLEEIRQGSLPSGFMDYLFGKE